MCAPPPSYRSRAATWARPTAALTLRLILTALALWLAWAQIQPGLGGRAVTAATYAWAQLIAPRTDTCLLTPA